MPARGFERYAWGLLFAIGVFFFIISIVVMVDPVGGDPDFEPIAGRSWDAFAEDNPEVAEYIGFVARSLGGMTLVVSLLVMAVVWKSYRAGERWSWYALWSLPLGLGLFLALVLGNGGASWPLWGVLLVVALLGLLLPFRIFFQGA